MGYGIQRWRRHIKIQQQVLIMITMNTLIPKLDKCTPASSLKDIGTVKER